MRILVIADGIPVKKTPLSGIFAFDQAKALENRGHKVIFIALDLRSIRRPRRWGLTNGIKDGVEWYQISIPIGAIAPYLFCRIGGVILYSLYKKLNICNVDVIHAHFFKMGAIAAYLSKKTGIPLVITEHSSELNKENVSKEIIKSAVYGYEQASALIAVSNALSCRIREHTGYNSLVIPNIIDLDIFSKVHKVKHNGYRIITVSNLVKGKRTIKLLEALNLIKEDIDNIHLDIIGDGDQRTVLEQYVANNNLNNIASFYGYKSRDEIRDFYSKTDCFIMVSEAETFGVVYAEAMAAGLPVIATKCGGPQDFVDNSNGILVDVDNVEQIAKALKLMRQNTYDYMKISNNIVSKYSANNIAERLELVYRSLQN